MLKQEWGYEYLGHLRSPQQPIEVGSPWPLCLDAPACSLPLKGLSCFHVEREICLGKLARTPRAAMRQGIVVSRWHILMQLEGSSTAYSSLLTCIESTACYDEAHPERPHRWAAVACMFLPALHYCY